jgi:diguanylate cyclase (GGDEF)-like protein
MESGFGKRAGRERGAGFGAGGRLGGPFTQGQILHLMKTEFARARRYGYPLSCLLLQVDRIDNLTYMHGAALRDSLRRELGKLVQEKTRGADHLGLISEDRFLLVLPHTDEGQAQVVAERIRSAFVELEIEVGGQPLALGLSIGLAAGGDQDTLFFETMLSQAEVALEWAIEARGNQCKVFNKERFLHGLGEAAGGADEPRPAGDPP